MPLTTTVKNQIAARLDTLFDAIEAGTAFETQDWLHDSRVFAVGERHYCVQMAPEGDVKNPSVVLRVKRIHREP